MLLPTVFPAATTRVKEVGDGYPAEPAMHAHHDIDWEYVDAHHPPVTLVCRPVYEGWVLTLFGLILVGLIGLLGWTGYALSTVKAELR